MDQTGRRAISRLLIGPEPCLHWFSELLLLGARVYAGFTMAMAGLDKLPTPDWMVDQVEQIGVFPSASLFAAIACLAEFVCGLFLVVGLATRISAILLAVTMGFAAFGFQGATPLTGMHIAQHFFWLFVVFIGLGGGRFSFDGALLKVSKREGASSMRSVVVAVYAVTATAIAGFAFYRELSPPPVVEINEESEVIKSVSVAGSFNSWDPTATPLTDLGDAIWMAELEFSESQPIEFKFVANGDWAINVGDDDQTSERFPVEGTGERNGGNIAAFIPSPGVYRVELNLDTMAYRFEAVEAAAE